MNPMISRQAIPASFDEGRRLQVEGRLAEAASVFRSILETEPGHVDALLCLGAVTLQGGDEPAARRLFLKAAECAPSDFRPRHNLAAMALKASRLEEALKWAQEAFALRRDLPEAARMLGAVHLALGRSAEALGFIEHASDLAPDDHDLFLKRASMKRELCDWRDFEADDRWIRAFSSAGRLVPPFALLATNATIEEQHACAIRWASRLEKPASAQLPRRGLRCEGRVTIGYLSGDFHDHATSRLTAELFERHDRTRFAVHGYSYGPDTGDSMRQRVRRSFDVFRDMQGLSSQAAAQRIWDDEVDILIDLKGYTSRARSDILSYRPAPIQVNWLGFPGTMGAGFIDYVITDRFASPPEYEACSTERFAYLPNCFQPNDTIRPVPAGATRSDFGIPEDRFVLCCFNAPYKFTPAVFDVWMRILKAVPDGMLWLLVNSRQQAANLVREAVSRGVAADRLHFAPHADADRHLLRCSLSDLFLDTQPVSAFTTASDALWAGLPILTCAGPTPAGRGAGSLLAAFGLPELIAADLADYEARAVRLATHRRELTAIRHEIVARRTTACVFDTPKFVHDLEEVYLRLAGR